MKTVASCVMAAVVAGCGVCAMEETAPSLQRATEVAFPSPPVPERAPKRVTPVRLNPERLSQAIVVDAQGRPVARVEGSTPARDGGVATLTIRHGADGSGVKTVTLPFTDFEAAGELDGAPVIKTRLVLKPLPEFAEALAR